MKQQSTLSKKDREGLRPHPDFPLFPHASGRWAKKVHGRLCYFGRWGRMEKGQVVPLPDVRQTAEDALEQYKEQIGDLSVGRTPHSDGNTLTLAHLCNRFSSSKKTDLNAGRIAPRTFAEYVRATDLLVDTFGRTRAVSDLRPVDFEKLYRKLSAKWGVNTLGREITMVRSVFKYADETGLIDKVVKFGPKFKAPSKTDRRKAKAKVKRQNGKRMFTAADILALVDAAGPQLKAMILLGINGGLGNTDCATLPMSALDLDGGWLDFPRPKTGVERRIPLWPETVEAIRAAIASRPKAKDKANQDLVFLTRLGKPWVRYELVETKTDSGKVDFTGKPDDAIAKEMRKLLEDLGIYRPRVTFYALRHTFETVGGGSRDQVAVDAIMGHVDNSMAGEYREGIEDERLKAVTDTIHNWLFAEDSEKAGE